MQVDCLQQQACLQSVPGMQAGPPTQRNKKSKAETRVGLSEGNQFRVEGIPQAFGNMAAAGGIDLEDLFLAA
jgi:hypothetical protein